MGTVDQGFVPAPPERVYARLASVERYGEWWPSRLGATIESVRPGTGLVLRMPGGSLEWYLQPFKDGTLVNAILDLGETGERAVVRARRDLRSALIRLRALEEGS